MAVDEEQCKGMGKANLFSASKEVALKSVTIVSASLSVLGAAFIILGYIVLADIRNISVNKLVVNLSIADLFASITLIVDASAPIDVSGQCPTVLCYILGCSYQLFSLASILWTASICHSVYSVLSKAARQGYIETLSTRRIFIYHCICWCCPLLTVGFIMAVGGIGGAGQQCWINEKRQWVRFIFFFLPLLVIECYNLTVYRIVSRAVTQTLARDTVFSRIKRYIFVSLVCKGLALANRAHAYFAPTHPLFVLYLVSCIGTPLQGLGNALVFGDQRRLRTLFKKICKQRHPAFLGLGPAYEPTGERGGIEMASPLPGGGEEDLLNEGGGNHHVLDRVGETMDEPLHV